VQVECYSQHSSQPDTNRQQNGIGSGAGSGVTVASGSIIDALITSASSSPGSGGTIGDNGDNGDIGLMIMIVSPDGVGNTGDNGDTDLMTLIVPSPDGA